MAKLEEIRDATKEMDAHIVAALSNFKAYYRTAGAPRQDKEGEPTVPKRAEEGSVGHFVQMFTQLLSPGIRGVFGQVASVLTPMLGTATNLWKFSVALVDKMEKATPAAKEREKEERREKAEKTKVAQAEKEQRETPWKSTFQNLSSRGEQQMKPSGGSTPWSSMLNQMSGGGGEGTASSSTPWSSMLNQVSKGGGGGGMGQVAGGAARLAAGGGGTGGGATATAGIGALGTLGGVVTGAVVAVGLYAAAVITGANAVKQMGQNMLNANLELAKFSPLMARVALQEEIDSRRRGRKIGDATAESAGGLQSSLGTLKDTTAPISILGTTIGNKLMSAAAFMATAYVAPLGIIADGINEVVGNTAPEANEELTPTDFFAARANIADNRWGNPGRGTPGIPRQEQRDTGYSGSGGRF